MILIEYHIFVAKPNYRHLLKITVYATIRFELRYIQLNVIKCQKLNTGLCAEVAELYLQWAQVSLVIS